MPYTAPSGAPVQGPSHPTKLLLRLRDVREDLSSPAAAAGTSCVSAADTNARNFPTSRRSQRIRISRRLRGAFMPRGRSPSSYRLRLLLLFLLIPLALLREPVLHRWVPQWETQELAELVGIVSRHLVPQHTVLHHALRRNILTRQTQPWRTLLHTTIAHHTLPRHTPP